MIRSFLKKIRTNEKGATAIEYGLIAALVSVVAITALTSVGTSVKAKFEAVETAMQ